MSYFDYVDFIGFAFPLLIILCIGYYLPSIIKNRTLSAESHAEDRFSENLRLLDTSNRTGSRSQHATNLVLGGKMQRPTAPKQRESANYLVLKKQYLQRRQQLQKQAKYRLLALLISLGLIVVSVGLTVVSILSWPWMLGATAITVICLIQSGYAGAMARTELADMRTELREMGAALPAGRSLSETEKRIQQLHRVQRGTASSSVSTSVAEEKNETIIAEVSVDSSKSTEANKQQSENINNQEKQVIATSAEEVAKPTVINYEKATFTPAQLVLEEETVANQEVLDSGREYLNEIVERHKSAKIIATTSEYVAALPATAEVKVVSVEALSDTEIVATNKATIATELNGEKTTESGATWTPMRVPAPVYALKQTAKRRHVDAKVLLEEHLEERTSRVPYRPKDIHNLGKETVSTTELAAQEAAAGLVNVDSILEQRRAAVS